MAKGTQQPKGRGAGPRPARARVAALRVLQPIQAFVATESASGIVLLVATVAAVVWANSPWDGSYNNLWHSKVVLETGIVAIREDLGHFINDGLMAIFFFVIGLEIKRELVHGELASPRRAALPVAAALGGMAVPALIFTAWNAGGDGSSGWGIPMATDVAFALGALALVGRAAPFGLKVMLLALAVVDDLGAIAVIVLFYTESLSIGALAWAALFTAILAGFATFRVGHPLPWVVVAIALWVAVLESGVHATVAGVIVAVLVPARATRTVEQADAEVEALLDAARAARSSGDRERDEATLDRLGALASSAEAPLDRVEHAVHPWVSFVIIPIFALANAGVVIDRASVEAAANSAVTAGVAFGLVVGKPVGIFAFAWLAVRLGWAVLPTGVNFAQIAAMGLIAGIGFTVSLFITGLAYDDAGLVAEAKLGILAASVLAAVGGSLWLRAIAKPAAPA
ncbi:MAG: Na+/H+ antiporter NhaA [Dehalococcoidia bacterium]